MISEYFVEVTHGKNTDRTSPIPSKELDRRLQICSMCENLEIRSCRKLGCSSWRFQQVLLSEKPNCPEGKHEVPPS